MFEEAPPTKITVSKNTSETRYDNRRKQWVSDFKGKKKLVQTLKHYGWWIVHNFIAHPLLAFLYKLEISVKIHDWTSQKLNKINGNMHTSIQSNFYIILRCQILKIYGGG